MKQHKKACVVNQGRVSMAGDMLVMSKSQMEQLAVIFARQKETAEGVISAIGAGIDGTTWQGARADRFRQLWETEFRPNLRALCDALGEHSTFISAELQAGVSALDTV
ncbi:MAG: WXG100 family type VII secretion target [Acidimicrobiaceae bacterium]|nr:WXG100 family type VII secretion target [Acidimicrobiaceae bacterium]MXZ52467.1 WXG100 family type VII secretion target [Acidimicrobiaceae bacterium]MYB87112.1 WXG100 family type VII secretion target [Acidimicrobiaceae bacterium]MYE09109.1 WXG100 family type VII secretion target [Acidimicrobiaceae bacterium]MYI36486.1 WXG100 family type VII secretion target [Acidimicrobiaceae bacterium]